MSSGQGRASPPLGLICISGNHAGHPVLIPTQRSVTKRPSMCLPRSSWSHFALGGESEASLATGNRRPDGSSRRDVDLQVSGNRVAVGTCLQTRRCVGMPTGVWQCSAAPGACTACFPSPEGNRELSASVSGTSACCIDGANTSSNFVWLRGSMLQHQRLDVPGSLVTAYRRLAAPKNGGHAQAGVLWCFLTSCTPDVNVLLAPACAVRYARYLWAGAGCAHADDA